MKDMKQKALALILLLFSLSAWTLNLDELLPDERNNVEIFQKYSPNVVYVHRLASVAKPGMGRAQVKAGAGSGIIWDKLGHIVTNYHVIKDADNVAVSIGKLTVSAKVVGAEPRKDIALLKINSKSALSLLNSFQPFQFVHSKDLMVGQKVLAIGNPFGLDRTLTLGNISALGRQVPGIGGVTIHDMIQTDAPINPGNSGGPLLDSKGRLIGLNTIIFSNSGTSAGIGFAVPADDIERLVPQLIKNGRVVLAGIGIRRLEANVAANLGVLKGVLIGDVMPRTPAAAAGLRGTYRDHFGRIHVGDVIVALNAHPVKNYDELYNLLTSVNVGDTVKLTVIRERNPLTLNMKTIDIAATY